MLLSLISIAFITFMLVLGYTSWGKGKSAEWIFPLFLRFHLGRKNYHILNNLALRLPDGSTTQIDHVIVSRYGIFVIELKNYSGWIFGDEKSKVWTQTFGKNRKFTFQNPLRQNYRHVMAIAELTNIPQTLFKPVVAFLYGCKIKTRDQLPTNVMYTGELAKHILSHKEQIIKDEQVPEVVEVIRAWQRHGNVSNREHIRNLRDRHDRPKQPESAWDCEPATTRTCPRCQKPLVLRHPRHNPDPTKSFWGCTGFPACRYTEQP